MLFINDPTPHKIEPAMIEKMIWITILDQYETDSENELVQEFKDEMVSSDGSITNKIGDFYGL